MAGTHPRSRSKPDAKNMSGSSVQEALNIQSDSSFALKAARSDLPPDPNVTAIIGAVGTSPYKSLVWNRRVTSLEDFVSIAGALQISRDLSLYETYYISGDRDEILKRRYPTVPDKALIR